MPETTSMGLLKAIGLLIRAGIMATIGLLKVGALKLALPLLRAAAKIEGVAKRAQAAAADCEKQLETERSRLD
ncbi:MAG TPA: hypothetical protein VEQ60_22980 [Longimicrobium sp.]|nr:hypothetical protein [Longimicrobium sp.]